MANCKFQNGVLKINGLRKIVLFFLSVFLVSILYVTTLDIPAIVEVGIWLSSLVLIWGIYDVLFSKMSLRYDVNSKWLSIRRRSPQHKFKYEGKSTGKLKVLIQNTPVDNGVKHYNVIIVFEDDSNYITFPLELFTMSLEMAERNCEKWQRDLDLQLIVSK